ncbi:hypothetical protein GCM10010492_45010 [Saccharothrix mutabilis subsp. mutabilis]|uniref:DUF4328 domain-containing protein n=1 Tax=Saccharothrix mutabilis subsp. mutabilis TaxID=66855 RepID=A0ABP3DSL0_9PSEU
MTCYHCGAVAESFACGNCGAVPAPPDPMTRVMPRQRNLQPLENVLVVVLVVAALTALLALTNALAAVVQAVLSLVAAVLFLVWLWQARANTAHAEHRFSPEWVVAGWFVPLANFYIPLRVVLDVRRASLPEGGRTRAAVQVWAWWVAWCLSWVTSLEIHPGGFYVHFLPGGTWLSAVFLTVAGVGLAVTVAKVGREQRSAAGSGL